MHEDLVNLAREGERASREIDRLDETHVALCVAAAITLHRVHADAESVVTRADYEDALNIAAAALSRLITVFTVDDSRAGRNALRVDLVRYRFSRGATELRAHDGETIRRLSVSRSELLSAIPIMRRAGIPFRFALAPFQTFDGEPSRAGSAVLLDRAVN